MTVLRVPGHVDDYLPDLDLPLPAPGGPDRAAVTGALPMLLATGRVVALGVACSRHPGQGAAAAVGPGLKSALAADIDG